VCLFRRLIACALGCSELGKATAAGCTGVLSTVRRQLGEKYEYGQIKAVMAMMTFGALWFSEVGAPCIPLFRV
jgi:hypothetical protein